MDYEKNSMRGMMKDSTFRDFRADKSNELNDDMSIVTTRAFDEYGKKTRNLSLRDNSYATNDNPTRDDQ